MCKAVHLNMLCVSRIVLLAVFPFLYPLSFVRETWHDDPSPWSGAGYVQGKLGQCCLMERAVLLVADRGEEEACGGEVWPQSHHNPGGAEGGRPSRHCS